MADKTKAPVKARDMAAPEQVLILDGQRYTLLFSNQAARLAEDVYEDHYRRDVGYGDIMQEMARGKYRAMMAVLYGALVAGGHDMSWDDFDRTFKLDSLPQVQELLAKGIIDSLPAAGDEDDDPKNG